MTPIKPTYITTLTPLRGIAALLVVVFHCNLMMQTFLPAGYTQFLNNAWLWVDFFFVLSGFIMCYVYGKYFKTSTSAGAYKKYMVARFARVYPLHFVTLIWAIASALIIRHFAKELDPFIATVLDVKYGAPASFVLIQSLHLFSTAPLNTPSWSLSTEWWVYVIFPFIVPLFANIKAIGKVVALLLIITFFLLIRYWLGPISDTYTHAPGINMIADFAFFRCLAGFLLGMLTFSFYEAKAGYALLKNSWCFLLFAIGTIIAMHFGIMDILIVAFFPFILLTAAYNTTSIKQFLDKPILQRLGDWSFSIYMVHMPLIMFNWIYHVYKEPAYFADLGKLMNQPANYMLGIGLCLLIVTLTLLIASLTYKYIEVPARNYVNKIFEKRTDNIIVETAIV